MFIPRRHVGRLFDRLMCYFPHELFLDSVSDRTLPTIIISGGFLLCRCLSELDSSCVISVHRFDYGTGCASRTICYARVIIHSAAGHGSLCLGERSFSYMLLFGLRSGLWFGDLNDDEWLGVFRFWLGDDIWWLGDCHFFLLFLRRTRRLFEL